MSFQENQTTYCRRAGTKVWLCYCITNLQQDDIMLSAPPSGQGAGGGARTRDRRIRADLRADSLATVPLTPR
ncbi:hypothetical protein PoB_004835700 [Plakobranchus ocellatus]|uniref:Uncharacterized protein n=1 Tax=Plakobranchus ocellatus TaxID=259542 RepID=A0AAV4BR83_9GAST|nr:hypothetical protein PoB_004835700 [Plakobranchus ocellatus]